MNLRDPYGEKCREADDRAAIERDAERYRWLKRRIAITIIKRIDPNNSWPCEERLDGVIDASMQLGISDARLVKPAPRTPAQEKRLDANLDRIHEPSLGKGASGG